MHHRSLLASAAPNAPSERWNINLDPVRKMTVDLFCLPESLARRQSGKFTFTLIKSEGGLSSCAEWLTGGIHSKTSPRFFLSILVRAPQIRAVVLKL